MSHFSSFVLRIISDSGDVIDWSVNSTITFRDVLEAISQIVPQATATAFDYEDEDGDKITVRSDDELKAMINGYFLVHSQRMKQGKNDLEPLSIFPRACKTPRKRNVCGLTINTKAAAVSNSSVSQNAHVNCSSVIKKEPENFRNILARGQISADQIQHLEILGHGNGGTVYRALHETTNKVIAVKVIPLDVTPEIQKQIIQELEILFQCSSPFIIEFYGAFFVESRISICTEFMDGGSLEMYGKIPEPVLGRITAAVVKGLVYLWELKIMHRDVKPSNILVNTRGQVKMCDFGVSRQLVNSIATTYVGTNAYMAPERILGSEYSVRSELWSLGVSLLEMSLGRFPYPTENPGKVDTLLPIELLQCIVHENPPRLPEGRFSLAFADFISQCMRKNPLARPAPEALMGHPFIRSNDDGNIDIISMWVCRQLEDIKSRAQSMDSPISQE